MTGIDGKDFEITGGNLHVLQGRVNAPSPMKPNGNTHLPCVVWRERKKAPDEKLKINELKALCSPIRMYS